MEKLQAALEKAREARNPTSPMAHQTHYDGTSRTKKNKGLQTDLWEALTPIDVSDQHLSKHRVVTRQAGPSAAPFDILRTKVLLQMRQNGWKRLAITSPMPNSGKTTTACNLALGLGRQKDLRAILMDLDLRDPSVHSFFRATPSHGIGDLLAGRVEFNDQALRIGDNVAVSMSLAAEGDPTRLLLAEETADIINHIEREYKPDIMVFDLPSVLVNDDTRAFLKNVDCALIVARTNSTRYSQFDTCEREIAEQTNVLGTILNAYLNVGTVSEQR
ncbi:CpsD/CapB family tyrosine-protein kinase [Roseobacter litoralis]|uniref:Tyrosine-protein kinase-like protein n=1 Tax=Roseobacter litoralis (strain ATCC 49566 / DSM 6996 / JCM 21268 / NBRC 15278 / OCh 149) TaxID=391595 RepID=F7ZMM8_ROSLO|nr:CpsD/CapB family tyrosine-protein kinase [Roseobacter litoralis]AEI96565.1 tyrosine-protein kinase-like protein [Roseobacter litoralis Och 149]